MATGYYLQDNPNPSAPQYGWARNRVSGVIGVHTAENNTCFNGPDSGDVDVAGFISRRADYGSYHVLADTDSINPLIHPSWAAWADTTNNAHAMSVSAAVRANDWMAMSPERREQVVKNLAVGAARLVQTAVRDGLLATPTPARRISAAEAISGSRAGFYGHGETNPGTRYDPGKDFDWDLFLSTYASAIGGVIPVGKIDTSEEDFMAGMIDARQAEDIAQRAAALVFEKLDNKMRISAIQAESIVAATTTRTVEGVDAKANGKTIDRRQADDIAQAAARYSKEAK